MREILDPLHSPYPIPKFLLVRDLMEGLGSRNFYGDKIAVEYLEWLEKVQPTDRYGYPYLHTESSIKSWRDSKFSRLLKALDTIAECEKEMGMKTDVA